MIEAKALSLLSLLAARSRSSVCIGVFAAAPVADGDRLRRRLGSLDIAALAATAITASCPLFWYLARPADERTAGPRLALAAQACLVLAWWRQTPAPDGDRRLSPARRRRRAA